jgi:uncharacterized protein
MSLAGLLTWLGVTVFVSIVVVIFGSALGYSVKHPPPGVNIAGTLLQDMAMIGVVLLFTNMVSRPLGADFGLRVPPIGKAIGGLLAVWVGFFLFSYLWKVAVSLNQPQNLPDELGIKGSALNLALVLVVITVVAPLCEEFFFRGYVFGALFNWKGVWPAAIITGLLFGAAHIGSSPIGYTVPLAFFGFGLCLLYRRTGSLYPCIALHALNNALALGADQHYSWQIAPMMVGAVCASLGLAALLSRAVDRRAASGGGPLPQPAV